MTSLGPGAGILVEMENLPLKNKFRNLLQKTGKLNLDFNFRQDSHGSPGAEGRIPAEWVGLVGVGSPGRRDEGVFVSDDNEMSKTDDEVLSGWELYTFYTCLSLKDLDWYYSVTVLD